MAPLKGELSYVGRLFVNAYGKPMEILTKLNEMAGFAPDEEITLFEEIKFEPFAMCEPVDKMFTFRLSQSLKMGTSFAIRNPLKLKVVNISAILTFLHSWNMCIIIRRLVLQGLKTKELSWRAGHQHESPHPFQENNSGNVVDVTTISREFNFLQPVRRDLTSTEALNLGQEERVPLESIPHMSYHQTPPPPPALRPT